MSVNPNENKTKLNQLWNDLKFNLPEINFNDDETITSSDDNVSTLAVGSMQNLDLDSIEIVEKQDLDDFVEVENIKEEEEEKSSSPTKWLEYEKNFEKFLQKDADQEAYLSDTTNEEDENNKTQLEEKNFETYESPRRLQETFNSNNNQLKSNEQAVKITKNIFETTNPKLSMVIFDQFNIDELLDKVEDDTKYLNYTPNKLPTPSRLVNDENVLMKLAQMSHLISKDEDLTSVDLKTGAIKPSTSKSCGTSTNSTPFTLIEKELNKNFSFSEQIIKNDLNNFLKQHNIRDGNLVATRRIDLRPNQQTNNTTSTSSTNSTNNINKKPELTEKQKAADVLMQNILNSKDDEKYFRNKSKGPLKFINDSDLSSSSSDSDEDELDSKSLWIERYRRQKMNK